MERLHNLADGVRPGFKAGAVAEQTTTPTDRLARAGSRRLHPTALRPRRGTRPPAYFEWAARSRPLPDCVRTLRNRAVRRRRAVKWLPAMAMNRPGAAYAATIALARLGIPLITPTLARKGRPRRRPPTEWGNPRCACAGRWTSIALNTKRIATKTPQHNGGRSLNFDLFARLMAEPCRRRRPALLATSRRSPA